MQFPMRGVTIVVSRNGMAFQQSRSKAGNCEEGVPIEHIILKWQSDIVSNRLEIESMIYIGDDRMATVGNILCWVCAIAIS